MKDVRLALTAFLYGDAAINTVVQGNVTRQNGGSRIFAGILPQGTTGASIVQNLISEGSDLTMQGRSGLGQARVQVDCWALNQNDAVTLANLVFDRLAGHHGTIAYGSNSPQDEIVVQGIMHEQGRDDYDSVAQKHRRSRDYRIWYRES